MKKIAIDISSLNSGHSIRGIGVNTKELISALQKINLKNISVDALDFKISKPIGYDLAHYTSFNPYFLSIPINTSAKKNILTIHDLIYLVYPDQYPSGIKGRFIYNLQKRLLKKMDAIITISETSKDDIINILDISPNKVYAVYLGVKDIYFKEHSNSEEVLKKYDIKKPYVLYVGDVNFNKNIMFLADACKNINFNLVIVGKRAADNFPQKHIENQPFIDFLNKYKDDSLIKRIGFVPDEDLAKLYHEASLYCQPSLYEGFGLNSLEAMACGAPVLASDIKVHNEILKDNAVFFDSNSLEDLQKKITKISSDIALRNNFIKKGKLHSKQFKWEKTAKELANIYEKILE